MEARNTTIEELEEALRLTNKAYARNLCWAVGPTHLGSTNRSRIQFRLRTVNTRGPGGRRGYQYRNDGERRRLGGCACWHAHGDFFEALFQVNPKAIVRALGQRTITSEHGNWKDRRCGSMMEPVQYSELCDCPQSTRRLSYNGVVR